MKWDHQCTFKVWAADDFEIFKRMMLQKNIELQLQALELLQQRFAYFIVFRVLKCLTLCAGSCAYNGQKNCAVTAHDILNLWTLFVWKLWHFYLQCSVIYTFLSTLLFIKEDYLQRQTIQNQKRCILLNLILWSL